MPLPVGTKLGHYEVLSLLGVGGMGEVYCARDTTLKRDVALKVLPLTFVRDPDRMARFQREAEVLASLDHPNIGHIYGLVDAEDSRALVLGLIEGPTLAERIQVGPVPLDEALAISKQIIEALEYAHERGVVHRDLKPANIKITPEGAVKVLDFGLAKVLEDEPPPSSLTNSPTLTLGHTRTGVILGTASYMSPEQAVGRPVDRRSDIFSFAAVLFEMLTGKRAFTGATTPDVLEAVVKSDPDWSALPARTPGYLRTLLERMLTKDRKQRLQAIGEARIALENPDRDEPVPATAPSRSRLGWVAGGVAALSLIAVTTLGFVHFREAPPQVLRFSVPPPEKGAFALNGLPAVSPDGRHIAYVINGKVGLWVRDVDSLTARLLVAEPSGFPFWSPDSRTIGFFSGGKLKKIDASGGPALTLCDAANGLGGAWSQDGVLFSASSAISRVAAAGGIPMPVTALDKASNETYHVFPWFLPDGRHFLYTDRLFDEEKTAIYIGDLESKERRRLMFTKSNAIYSPPGYILFLREHTLMAQPFDADKFRTTGDAIPIAEQVASRTAGTGLFSVSENGVLAYVSGALNQNVQLTWFDRSGKPLGTIGGPSETYWAAISPDGKTVAFDRLDTQFYDIWLRDLARGTESRFTFGPKDNRYPVWSPDGKYIAFSSDRNGSTSWIYQKAVGGIGQDELVDGRQGQAGVLATGWSADGHYLLEATGLNHIWVVPMSPEGGERKPYPYLSTDFSESMATLSPNGRWLAYRSNETKRNEIYVMTFPNPGGKWQISTSGGAIPVWSRDGKELFFVSLDNKMMGVEIKGTSSNLEAGVPQALFDARLGANARFDVSKDGKFLIPTLAEESAGAPMTVVVNWTAGLKK